jgi:hypothetical protein
MVSIARALERVKRNVADVLSPESIQRACREAGHRWRERELGPVTAVHMFVHQILNGNTACNELPHISGKHVTGSAYCQARGRLPLEALSRLVRQVDAALADTRHSLRRWRGHQLAIFDGSSFSMPDTDELRAHFGQHTRQKAGCGSPTAHLLLLIDAGTHTIRDVAAAPWRTHDMSQAATLHPLLQEGDIAMGDRAFCSYVHLALCLQARRHGLFRAHQRTIIDFTPHRPRAQGKTNPEGRPYSRWIRSLGKEDQVVEWFKPPQRPGWMEQKAYDQLPPSILLRELRYRIRTPGCRTGEVTLVTTLLDAEKYPAQALAELYGIRWEIETDLAHLKTTMGLNVLKCKTVVGVTKELTMFVLVYNLVRTVMIEAARRQEVELRRISFVDALRWLKHAAPGAELSELVVNPLRPNRTEPRVKKRRPNTFPFMTKPREQLRRALLARQPKS